ncbi:hypothetical protein KUCAC02_026062 [Chaenocephalus aceratus]|uniref:Uncharacterized protein n=1 Tax=Chaenocephalus aceratus TaxID=36190 RepID=A0ACB9VX54_CHAAC|nr:hypothetical protein KUCAC02_026062 [Chaenocephalus aceratus]
MGPASTSALSPACSGARQQSSDDTAFGKQLPDAEVVATESIENWLTHRASKQGKADHFASEGKQPASKEDTEWRSERAFASLIADPIVCLK